MHADLKPCPFCRTEGKDQLYELWNTFDAGHIAYIHCTHCGADGPSVYSEESAQAAVDQASAKWNKRAAASAAREG